jgi:hypothetical protein
MQVWYNRLVLNGAGNDFYGDAALQVETNDNVWRGPITLNPNIAVTFQGAAASAALPTMLTTVNSPTGGTLTAITSTQGVSGVGSVPGVNAVQTLTFGGVHAGRAQHRAVDPDHRRLHPTGGRLVGQCVRRLDFVDERWPNHLRHRRRLLHGREHR